MWTRRASQYVFLVVLTKSVDPVLSAQSFALLTIASASAKAAISTISTTLWCEVEWILSINTNLT